MAPTYVQLAKMNSEFAKKVIQLIKAIPKGKVATYGQIAKLAGKPHAARGVAWILHSCSESHHLPWHRVIGSKGTISFPQKSKNYLEQKKKLLAEGVVFLDSDQIDLNRFQWKKRVSKKPKSRLQPRIFSDD